MIVVTGAAGFIASCLVSRLNALGYRELVLVDDFSKEEKAPNWTGKVFLERVERDQFFEWVKGKERAVQFIFHLGARTDTTEKDWSIFQQLNLSYSQTMWQLCATHAIPLVYASSAATYGDGALGFSDDTMLIPSLQPLNPYGESKQAFDVWALAQEEKPFFWAGLKFFNVYGPNEYHKGRMASVVYHTWKQVKATGGMKLFRSHHPDFRDGEQLRDFVYVMDVCVVLIHLMHSRRHPGIYNLGSGQARSFLDLARQVFISMGLEPNISFIDTPADIRDTYQYYTQADMSRLRAAGYEAPFTPLESGVDAYVREFLLEEKRF
jgi:ADP-L-glycero-D-manno-heptose 6-epimerase